MWCNSYIYYNDDHVKLNPSTLDTDSTKVTIDSLFLGITCTIAYTVIKVKLVDLVLLDKDGWLWNILLVGSFGVLDLLIEMYWSNMNLTTDITL